MSALDEVQAAIDKLTAQRDEAGYFEHAGWLCEAEPGDAMRSSMHPDGGPTPITNDPLIVTLHATIDAQLAILQKSLASYPVNPDWVVMFDITAGQDWLHMNGPEMSLARAINGGA